MAKRIKIGDVIQVLTSEGIAYAQYTHKNAIYGPLIAVFEGVYEHLSTNFTDIVDSSPQFFAFFPLQPAVNQGLITVVSNVPVSKKK